MLHDIAPLVLERKPDDYDTTDTAPPDGELNFAEAAAHDALGGSYVHPQDRDFQDRSPPYTPPGLDPQRFPIISQHFFGIQPLGATAAEIAADVRFARKVQRLHDLGARPVAELLAHLGAARGLATAIDELLDIYVGIPDAALTATGGRDLPPVLLREVR